MAVRTFLEKLTKGSKFSLKYWFNLKKNKVFIVIIAFILLVQVYLIYHGGDLFRTYGLTAKEFFIVLY